MPRQLTVPTGSPYTATDSDIGVIIGIKPNYYGTISSISQIKTVLGSSSSDSATLCKHININKWALFRPDSFMTSEFPYDIFLPVGGVNSPYRLGDFAGYNHQAKPPTHFTSVISAEEIEEFDTLIIQCDLGRGERLPIPVMASWDNVKVIFCDEYDNELNSKIVSVGIDGIGACTGYYYPSSWGEKVLKIKAYYYTDAYNSLIEDGIKEITVTVLPLQITAKFWSCSADAVNVFATIALHRITDSSKGLYYRLRVSGSGLSGTETWYKTLQANESILISDKYVTVVVSGTPVAQNATLYFECSLNSNFLNKKILTYKSFYWDGSGGAI